MRLKEYKYLRQDALGFLRSQEDESIRLAVASPPYNIGKEYETATSLGRYLEGFRPLLKEFCRALAKDGSVCS